MGGALLESWRKGEESFTIVDPYLDQAPEGVALFSSRDELGDERFDVMVVAIKPQLIEAVLPDYAGLLRDDGYLLSIAAGCSVARLREVSGVDAVVRVMPNLPAAIGQGVSGLCPSDAANETHIAHATDLMRRAGIAIQVDDEDALDRFTAIAGSGPGYVFEFLRAYAEASQELGFSREQSTAMALELVKGTVAMAQQSDLSLEELRNSVTSKNGTTEAGLNALNGSGALSALIAETFDAAYRRAIELR